MSSRRRAGKEHLVEPLPGHLAPGSMAMEPSSAGPSPVTAEVHAGRARGKRKSDGPMHDTVKGRVQAASFPDDNSGGPYEAVVKVFAVHCEPNYS